MGEKENSFEKIDERSGKINILDASSVLALKKFENRSSFPQSCRIALTVRPSGELDVQYSKLNLSLGEAN